MPNAVQHWNVSGRNCFVISPTFTTTFVWDCGLPSGKRIQKIQKGVAGTLASYINWEFYKNDTKFQRKKERSRLPRPHSPAPKFAFDNYETLKSLKYLSIYLHWIQETKHLHCCLFRQKIIHLSYLQGIVFCFLRNIYVCYYWKKVSKNKPFTYKIDNSGCPRY